MLISRCSHMWGRSQHFNCILLVISLQSTSTPVYSWNIVIYITSDHIVRQTRTVEYYCTSPWWITFFTNYVVPESIHTLPPPMERIKKWGGGGVKGPKTSKWERVISIILFVSLHLSSPARDTEVLLFLLSEKSHIFIIRLDFCRHVSPTCCRK